MNKVPLPRIERMVVQLTEGDEVLGDDSDRFVPGLDEDVVHLKMDPFCLAYRNRAENTSVPVRSCRSNVRQLFVS